MKKFICPCGSVFTNEDSLVSHSLTHVTVFENVSKEYIENIQYSLKEIFPGDEIQISNGDGSYSKFFISIQRGKMCIEQHLGNTSGNGLYPDKLEQAINEIHQKVSIAEYIEKNAMVLGGFEFFYCEKFEYRYSKSESCFHFTFQLKGDTKTKSVYFYPYKKNGETPHSFVNSLKQYILNELSGIVSYKSNGYSTTFYIDGIDISPLLNRGKKVRLEIID